MISLVSCNSKEEIYNGLFLEAQDNLNYFDLTEREIDESDSIVSEDKPLSFYILDRGDNISEIVVSENESFHAFYPVLNKTNKNWVMQTNYFYDSLTFSYLKFFPLDETCEYLDDYIATSKFKRYKSEITDAFDFTFYSKTSKYHVTYKGEVYQEINDKYYLSNQYIDLLPLLLSFLDFYSLWPVEILPEIFLLSRDAILTYQGESIETNELYLNLGGNYGINSSNYGTTKQALSINYLSSDLTDCIQIQDKERGYNYYLSPSGQIKYFSNSRSIYSWVAIYGLYDAEFVNILYTNIDFESVLKLFD